MGVSVLPVVNANPEHYLFNNVYYKLVVMTDAPSSAGVEALKTSDKMFSQCLVALVTSFAYSLQAATEGRLNGTVEYGASGAEAGQQWLRLVSSRGVLLHLQTTMLVDKVSLLSTE